jgi:hypothetical protein
MSAAIHPAILDTILGRLALLFLAGANNDLPNARLAAAQMLQSHDPQTERELRLAAKIISFSLHALEALSQAATPDMPLNKILRLRGGAVSLSREADKAERRLEQIQQARRDAIQPQPAEAHSFEAHSFEAQSFEVQSAEPPHPQADKAIALIEATRPHIRATAPNQPPVWSKDYQKQQAARRITENLKKNQAAHLAATNPTTLPAAPNPAG